MPAHCSTPNLVFFLLWRNADPGKLIQDIHVLHVPAQSIVMTDHGLTTVAITGSPAVVFEVHTLNHGHQQITIGKAKQIGVHSARAEKEIKIRPTLPLIL